MYNVFFYNHKIKFYKIYIIARELNINDAVINIVCQ